MKCYQLIGEVFWKKHHMQIFHKRSWDIAKRIDNVSKNYQTNVIMHFLSDNWKML